MEGVCRFFGSVITMGRKGRTCGPRGSHFSHLVEQVGLPPLE
jgi:hypothetical protein